MMDFTGNQLKLHDGPCGKLLFHVEHLTVWSEVIKLLLRKADQIHGRV